MSTHGKCSITTQRHGWASTKSIAQRSGTGWVIDERVLMYAYCLTPRLRTHKGSIAVDLRWSKWYKDRGPELQLKLIFYFSPFGYNVLNYFLLQDPLESSSIRIVLLPNQLTLVFPLLRSVSKWECSSLVLSGRNILSVVCIVAGTGNIMGTELSCLEQGSPARFCGSPLQALQDSSRSVYVV